MPPKPRTVRPINGLELRTPLLVPALSSMALGPLEVESEPGEEPERVACSIVHSELVSAVEHSLFISAYDICHGLLLDHDKFTEGFTSSIFNRIPVLMIDSGGYELARGSPGGVFLQGQGEPRPWQLADYEETVDNLDNEVKAILVSWDYYGPYREQIARAQEFFAQRPRFASTILLKPPPRPRQEKRERFHQLDQMSRRDFADLRVFDIVGVTDKELGRTVLSRMAGIAELRRRLDEVGVASPLHVFGGLDPLYTPLYFAAGAEIFDGLSWLRYAFREGVAMQRDAAAILGKQVSSGSEATLTDVALRNLKEINILTTELGVFEKKGKWSVFGRAKVLAAAYDAFEADIGEKEA